MNLRRHTWIAALACMTLACGEAERAQGAPAPQRAEAAKPAAAPAFERVWLRVDAPATDMELEAVRAGIVEAIEQALRGVVGLAHLTVEVRRGQARFELELESSRYAEAMDEVRARMVALHEAQPELGLYRAPRPYERADADVFVTYAVESVSYDLGALELGSRALVEALRGGPGVVEVERCAPRARLFVELDPQRLLAYAREPAAVAAKLRAKLDRSMSTRGVMELASFRHAELGGAANALSLASIAAFRISYREPPCVAAGPQGLAATVRVELAGPEFLERHSERIERVAAGLPAGVELRRIPQEAEHLRVSLVPTLDAELGAQRLGEGFGHAVPGWLVEVGGEAESCWGSGLDARVFLPPGTSASEVVEALERQPEVLAVDSGQQPSFELWHALSEQAGPDSGPFAQAQAGAEALAELQEVGKIRVHGPQLGPRVEVEADDARLSAYGLTRESFDAQLALIRGVEIGAVVDKQGAMLPVTLLLSNADGDSEAELEELSRLRDGALLAAGQSVPLTQVASLRVELQRERVCRRDWQPALLLSVSPAPNTERAQLERALGAALERGLAPGWTPGWR